MKRFLSIFLLFLLPAVARADWYFTATSNIAPLTASQAGAASVIVRENSSSPTAVFTIWPGAQPPATGATGTIVPAGQAYVFVMPAAQPVTLNQVIGYIKTSTSGPFNFVAITNAVNVAPSPPIYTVSKLPHGVVVGTFVTVRDGSSTSDCTTGGGSNAVGCLWTGTAWSAVGSGGPGGNPGGSSGQVQGNQAGAFGGIPGSSIDFTNGLLSLATPGTGTTLSVTGDAAGNDAVDIENTGWNNNAALSVRSDGSPATQGANAGSFGAYMTDNAGSGMSILGLSAGVTLAGSNVAGDFATALAAIMIQSSSGAAPDTLAGIAIDPVAPLTPNHLIGLQINDVVNAGAGTAQAILTGAGEVDLGGAVNVGTTGGGPGVVNVATGFRIGNAAPSGHVPIGNGTNYVDGPIPLPVNPLFNVDSSLTNPQGAGLYIPGTSLTAGSAYGFGSSALALSEASSSSTQMPAICLAVSTTQCMYSGVYRYTSTQSWTVGGVIYVSDGSAGALTQTAPTTSGHFVQRFGIALAADTILVMPSMDVATIQ